MVTVQGLIQGIAILIFTIGTFGVTYGLLNGILGQSGLVGTADPLTLVFITIIIVTVTLLGGIGVFYKVVKNYGHD